MLNSAIFKKLLKPYVEMGVLSDSDVDEGCEAIRRIQTKTNPDLNEIITIKEARKIVGLSKQGIYNLIKAGKLAKYKIKGALRFYKKDVLALMERC